MGAEEDQQQLLNNYLQLLSAISDGLRLAGESYRDRNYGSGDTLVLDLTNAFIYTNAFNVKLRNLNREYRKFVDLLDLYQSILNQIMELQTIVSTSRAAFLDKTLLPSYQHWYLEMKTYLEVRLYH
ncbi:MAG: hypothetical protein LRY71_18570 [Bacillaceae bacterium]|nr:hypothetical protein [Bacillaceae bacterium]